MNDPIDRAFKGLNEAEVPVGPSEELIQTTLRSVNEEMRHVASRQRKRRRRRTLSMAVAAAAAVVFGLTLFTLRNSEPPNGQRETVSRRPFVKSPRNVASAFVEADQLEPGQTFLLPVRGSAICVDPATWQDDLLTINSSAAP